MHKLFIALLLVTANDWKQCKRPTMGAGRINCSTYAVGSQEVAEENEKELYLLLWREHRRYRQKVKERW